MKPKALIVASVASMIQQFNMQNIQLLLEQGYAVDVVCNCKEGNTISDEKVEEMVRKLAEKGVSVTHVPIPRKICDVKGIFKSIKLIRKMCKTERYALMHCHSPIGSVVARAAALKARKNGTKVIYTAHGFHFYKGAPKKNWIIFYPIEKVFSYVTDVLITINKEDYTFAKKYMNAKQVEYLPGVGIDTEKFWLENFDGEAKRTEFGITKNDLMILSVGELNKNKNQEVIIRAIAKLNDSRIHYFIAGKGDKEEYLRNLAKNLGVNLQLLGYRADIIELLNTADIFVLPSIREGLSVALMEAMAVGLPCIASRIRGNVDLIEEGKGGYLCEPDDVDGFKNRIGELIFESKKKTEFSKFNRERITSFDIKEINDKMKLIYFCE